ncbi:hypothetical protein Psal006b_02440 [Piscirickettsia salmonis]|uniref:tRNA hydroxylase n=1 Tax=Piscirickettsia salmonis TaxID=1238 RepID=A0A1L6T9U1_PISSA|nr:hypothetical protein [Piscirickettsia salmonis]AKP73262.1 hypothetical protein PSLF89_1305 [Piscirickettsia salmonis LF-89 = ATCC VR-1361]ALB21956.1 tRNA hydroxylase [Piscirickettsia salmonis]ALY02114.1 hypothetical protein AWE47_03910 [Piscirickettsia salmonis]AMA41628.1 hypothetical protein AWJ11_03905 [Piscirickettsia salmonis]AOS34111.1 hypothetical protein AVM72_01140 [Piscirickettsia salmonis]
MKEKVNKAISLLKLGLINYYSKDKKIDNSTVTIINQVNQLKSIKSTSDPQIAENTRILHSLLNSLLKMSPQRKLAKIAKYSSDISLAVNTIYKAIDLLSQYEISDWEIISPLNAVPDLELTQSIDLTKKDTNPTVFFNTVTNQIHSQKHHDKSSTLD